MFDTLTADVDFDMLEGMPPGPELAAALEMVDGAFLTPMSGSSHPRSRPHPP